MALQKALKKSGFLEKSGSQAPYSDMDSERWSQARLEEEIHNACNADEIEEILRQPWSYAGGGAMRWYAKEGRVWNAKLVEEILISEDGGYVVNVLVRNDALVSSPPSLERVLKWMREPYPGSRTLIDLTPPKREGRGRRRRGKGFKGKKDDRVLARRKYLPGSLRGAPLRADPDVVGSALCVLVEKGCVAVDDPTYQLAMEMSSERGQIFRGPFLAVISHPEVPLRWLRVQLSQQGEHWGADARWEAMATLCLRGHTEEFDRFFPKLVRMDAKRSATFLLDLSPEKRARISPKNWLLLLSSKDPAVRLMALRSFAGEGVSAKA